MEHTTLSLRFSNADITELGRTARVYSELASRTEPTVSDVHMALIDAGTCTIAIAIDCVVYGLYPWWGL